MMLHLLVEVEGSWGSNQERGRESDCSKSSVEISRAVTQLAWICRDGADVLSAQGKTVQMHT